MVRASRVCPYGLCRCTAPGESGPAVPPAKRNAGTKPKCPLPYWEESSHLSLSVLRSAPVPCAAAMSRSPPGSSGDEETFFLEYRCHPLRPEPPSPTSPAGKSSCAAAPDATLLSALGSPTSAEPRRIVLSTDSPAALKVGTQQLIPRSLAVSSKTKNSPSRHQSLGAAGSSREPPGHDPKRASVPSLSPEEEVEDDGGGALKRNLRNMSYRAAMKGPGAELEPANAVPLLKPVSEEGSARPDRSPGRNKVGFAPAVTQLLPGGAQAPIFVVMSCCRRICGAFSLQLLSAMELSEPGVELAGLAEPDDMTCGLGSLRVTSRSPESPETADMAFVGSVTGCCVALAVGRRPRACLQGGVGRARGSAVAVGCTQTWVKQGWGAGGSSAGKVQE